ncbi:ABC-type nitrate/sulfonate/bicarbonate transport system permease component [Haloactinospora alba]|uniref:ABC-type nitrate/sulfonate/bicarbonate transport system permease component n=1 Tax=Haloactinospora alba TaxID=405555 RepID=A0A543NGZ8_9ACTN|nr:ABC-type nitrate/sulfonate/bicarbonate transport system permease component [Haloactinospora alba]
MTSVSTPGGARTENGATSRTRRTARLVRGAGAQAVRILLLPVLLVLLWWGYTATGSSYYMPTPGVIAGAFAETWLSDQFFVHALPSIGRLLAGFALAAVAGVIAGVALGLSPRARATAEPVLEFCRAIPPPVLVPLLMLLIGVNLQMKLAVIVAGSVWPILLNTIEGVRAVDPVLVDTCRCYRIRGWRWLTTLVLRSASPQMMAGLRQALSIAIILMVISEMFASSSGLGFRIVLAQRQFAIPEMWSGILLLGLLGFALSVVFGRVERSVLHWYEGARAASRGT